MRVRPSDGSISKWRILLIVFGAPAGANALLIGAPGVEPSIVSFGAIAALAAAMIVADQGSSSGSSSFGTSDSSSSDSGGGRDSS
jgi:hypothetical protein